MTDVRKLSTGQRYQLLSNAAIDQAMIMLDTQGHIVEWSTGAQQVFGWSPAEAIDQAIGLIFTAEDRATGYPAVELDAALQQGRAEDSRWNLRKDGTRLYTDSTTYPVYAQDGIHLGFGKVVRQSRPSPSPKASDPAQGHTAEREFLAAVLDNIKDGVIACDSAGNLTLVNRSVRKYHGLSSTDSWSIAPTLYHLDGVTPLPAEELPLVRALQGEQIRDVEMAIVRGTGELRILSASAQPLIGKDGETVGAVASVHDITSQREAQTAREIAVLEQARREQAEQLTERIRLSEERFRSLVMATAQVVWTTSLEGEILEDSPSWRAFTGQSFGELHKFGWLNAVHPDDRDLCIKTWLTSLSLGADYQIEYRLRRKDGVYRWTVARGVPIRAEDGAIREWVGINTDVTEAKAAGEALRASEQQALEAARQAESERNRLDAILAAVPVGILVADSRGTLLEGNAANRLMSGSQGFSRIAPHREWKGWWADGSSQHGEPVEFQDWPLIRALRGEEAPRAVLEIDSVDVPPVRHTAVVSAAPIRNNEGSITGAVAAIMDISDRVEAEASLRETAERLQFTLEAAQIGDWDLDLVSGVALPSRRHARCFGYAEPTTQWNFEIFLKHVHPHDREWVRQKFENSISSLKDCHLECRVVWPDNSVHWIAVHGSVYAANGMPTRMVGIVFDITDRKLAEEKVRHASLHDPLTGLPNRAMLFEYANHLLPHNRRTSQRSALLFFDLDRFKPINDSHGHEVGDAVLKEVARRFSKSLRAEDLVIRLGGDEFLVLLQDIKDTVYVAEVAQHIMERINEPYQAGRLELFLSTSVGISIFPDDGKDIDALVNHADMAMYQAKQSGRSNFQFYSHEFAAGMRLSLIIEQQLKSALSNGDFHLCYQPVFDIQSGRVASVEALLRWQDTEVGPAQFVPIAETTGIINPIGRWLLEETLLQHKLWVRRGLPPIPIAINVSPVEFRSKSFVSHIEDTIHKHGVQASALQMEITETAVMDDIDHAVTILAQLKALGVVISLDDFGTGHSSLAYLARLPLDKVKIDKSFIAALETDPASRTVTGAMIALARSLNLEIVAEGIESATVLDYICAHGCGQGQGFHLGKPMSGADFETWYRETLPHRHTP